MKLIAGVVVLVVLVLVFGGGFLPTQGTGNTEIDGVLKEKGIQVKGDFSESTITNSSVSEIEEAKQEIAQLAGNSGSQKVNDLSEIYLLKLTITQQEKLIEAKKSEITLIPTEDYCSNLVTLDELNELNVQRIYLMNSLSKKIDAYNSNNFGRLVFDKQALSKEESDLQEQENILGELVEVC